MRHMMSNASQRFNWQLYYFPDDDECSRGTSNCSTDATCSNTNGGFTCACPFHLTGDGYTCSRTSHAIFEQAKSLHHVLARAKDW